MGGYKIVDWKKTKGGGGRYTSVQVAVKVNYSYGPIGAVDGTE